MNLNNATDIALGAIVVLGWLSLASCCVVWCGTWAFLKCRHRFIQNLEPEDE